MNYRQAFEQWRRYFLHNALMRANGNVTEAARSIGVRRSLFYKFGMRSAGRNGHCGSWAGLQ